MPNVSRMIAEIENAVKTLDPEAIVQGMLYDEVGDHLVVTVVKGTRKTKIFLPGNYFADHMERLKSAVEQGINRLQREPVG